MVCVGIEGVMNIKYDNYFFNCFEKFLFWLKIDMICIRVIKILGYWVKCYLGVNYVIYFF